MEVDTPEPGAHPTYGGLNWGIQYNGYWGDYTVNHGYYGSHEDEGGQRIFEKAVIPHDLPLWCCDVTTEAGARTIWAERDRINAALSAAGVGVAGHVARGMPPVLPDHKGYIRIRVEILPDRFIIRPYDWATDFDPLEVTR